MTSAWITLSQLTGHIRSAVARVVAEHGVVRVLAEVSEIRTVASSGHTYLTLVERRDGKTVAQMDAVIWSAQSRILRAFVDATSKSLQRGMEVVLVGTPEYHSLYGLKLRVSDIDPTYTLGEMARLRREVLERLDREGLTSLNKRLAAPLVVQRIAVISSGQAAGYGDFVRHLESASGVCSFYVTLFEAVMQGDGAPASISAALASANRRRQDVDAAVVLRGGGSQVDLSCFDSYEVGRAIAQCSLPVITGIGHERDQTVADLVAWLSTKTPTAAASYLIDSAVAFRTRLHDAQRAVVLRAAAALDSASDRLARRTDALAAASVLGIQRAVLRQQKSMGVLVRHAHTQAGQMERVLDTSVRRLSQAAPLLVRGHDDKSSRAATALAQASRGCVEDEGRRLDAQERLVGALDPVSVLRRGFSITRVNGMAVTSADQAWVGCDIETQLAEGRLVSTVTRGEGNDE